MMVKISLIVVIGAFIFGVLTGMLILVMRDSDKFTELRVDKYNLHCKITEKEKQIKKLEFEKEGLEQENKYSQDNIVSLQKQVIKLQKELAKGEDENEE